jgi:hypothetical protein
LKAWLTCEKEGRGEGHHVPQESVRDILKAGWYPMPRLGDIMSPLEVTRGKLTGYSEVVRNDADKKSKVVHETTTGGLRKVS